MNLSIVELSEQTGLAINTIKTSEKGNGPAAVNVATGLLLVRTLESLGVTFVPAEDGLGAGARLTQEDAPLFVRRRAPKPADHEKDI